MKRRYWFALSLLIILTIIFGCVIYNAPRETRSSLANALQITSLLTAGIALIIALHSTNTKQRTATIDITICKTEMAHSVEKAALSEELKNVYSEFTDPIEAHRVHFKLTNTSDFDLTKPSFMFKVPIEKQHPTKNGHERTFHSNIYNTPEAVTLKMSDSRILSNAGLPHLNKGDSIEFWIKMALNTTSLKPFKIKVSINCENADGTTQEILVNPKEVIERADPNNRMQRTANRYC